MPGLVAIAVSTNASVFNMNAVQAGNLEAGLAGAQSVTQGYEGTGKFKGDKKDKVRIIANLYPEDMHLVLPKGGKLNSLKDLEGKRVGVASAGSGTQVSVKMILKHYGISVKENELGLKQSAQRLADGQLDAFSMPVVHLLLLSFSWDQPKDLSFTISQPQSAKKLTKSFLTMLSQRFLPELMRQSAMMLQQSRSTVS